MSKNLVALLILDGWGDGMNFAGNAITHSSTPNFDGFLEKYPNIDIMASGLDVGLPEGQMGNSEVGHTNIGAGRIVYQDLTRITKSIKDGDFFEKEPFLKAIENCKKYDSKLHLMGLYSPGGVHSHMDHIFALVELAKLQGLEKVYLHLFLDGRDVPPKSGLKDIEKGIVKLEEIGIGEIASIVGRYYAMDRDNRWDRIEKAYNMMLLGEGRRTDNPIKAIEESYDNDITDEFIEPIVITEDGKPVATMDDDDSIIFINFRPDRARQISHAILDDDFDNFKRKKEIDTLRERGKDRAL